MKTKFPLIIFFYLITAKLYSQQFITIEGKIVDSKTSEPLSYATIGIAGKTLGAISNANGEFLFHLPESLANDTFYISFLGYKTYKKEVNKVLPKTTYKLEPQMFHLREVSVSGLSANEIVKRAIKNVKNNYPQSPTIAETFYREYLKEDSVYSRAIEVAATIYSKGFKSDFLSTSQFKIDGIRLNKNNYRNGMGHVFDLATAWGFISYSLEKHNSWTYHLDSLTYYNGQLVYVISGVHKKDAKVLATKYSSMKTSDGSYIESEPDDSMLVPVRDGLTIQKYIITTDNFFILRFSECRDSRKSKKEFWISNAVKDLFEYSVSYKMEKNYSYPERILWHDMVSHYANNDLDRFINRSDEYAELLINKFDAENVLEIPKNERVNDIWNVSEIEKYEFNSEFWKNYNYMVDDSLRIKVFDDLNKTNKK